MKQHEILELINKISPQAKEYVRSGFERDLVDILYSVEDESNKGIFIKVEESDCCIFYVIFLEEEPVESILDNMKDITIEYIVKETAKSNIPEKEICFNVYGNNEKVIKRVRDLGFESDLEGYHMEFMMDEVIESPLGELIKKEYKSEDLSDFITLFDEAYKQLIQENGWELGGYTLYQEQFSQRLAALNEQGQVSSFWLGDDLIGTYIFEGNYITDLVVRPTFQNRGYGSVLLTQCIKDMKKINSIEHIRLRVAKSNVGAKRFYERNHFAQIASFAEHTLKR